MAAVPPALTSMARPAAFLRQAAPAPAPVRAPVRAPVPAPVPAPAHAPVPARLMPRSLSRLMPQLMRQMRQPRRLECSSAGRADPVGWIRPAMTMEAVIMTTLLDGGSLGTRPGGQPGPAAERADWSAQELLDEMAGLLRDSRPGLLAGMAALAAMTVGLAVEVTAFSVVSRPAAAVWACAGLFALVAVCWLRAAALFMLSGAPLGHALGRLRAHAGAPLDPRAPWARPPAGDSRGVDLGPRAPDGRPGPCPVRAHPARDELDAGHWRRLPGLVGRPPVHPVTRLRGRSRRAEHQRGAQDPRSPASRTDMGDC